jgi:hypothetical protein
MKWGNIAKVNNSTKIITLKSTNLRQTGDSLLEAPFWDRNLDWLDWRGWIGIYIGWIGTV